MLNCRFRVRMILKAFTHPVSLVRYSVLALALTSNPPVHAQDFPTRPVRIVNPYPAGGTLDAAIRLIAQKMTEDLGQPVLVENRTGAGGLIGLSTVAKAPPDGHTIVAVANSFAVYPAVRTDLPYDTVKDFKPVTFVGSTPHILAVPSTLPANSVKELVALAKAKPKSISYGTIGEGSYSHLVGKVFEEMAGVELMQVPYRGSAPTITAAASGEISMVFGNFPEIMPLAKAGRLKALAIATAQRSPLAPEIPTVAEAGYPGFTSLSWYGFMAPGATPATIVDKLQQSVARALTDPAVKSRFTELGVVPGGDSPSQFAAFLQEQMATYARIAKAANITMTEK